jgi:hypothetical protein
MLGLNPTLPPLQKTRHPAAFRVSLALDGFPAVHDRAAGRLREQLVERLALSGVEAAEHVVLERREGELRLRERLAARRGELDDVPAAVGGRAG